MRNEIARRVRVPEEVVEKAIEKAVSRSVDDRMDRAMLHAMERVEVKSSQYGSGGRRSEVCRYG